VVADRPPNLDLDRFEPTEAGVGTLPASKQVENHPIGINVSHAGSAVQLVSHPGLTRTLRPVDDHYRVLTPHASQHPAPIPAETTAEPRGPTAPLQGRTCPDRAW
jgi:hypothetical protein